MEDVAEPCSIAPVQIETKSDKVAFGVFMMYIYTFALYVYYHQNIIENYVDRIHY